MNRFRAALRTNATQRWSVTWLTALNVLAWCGSGREVWVLVGVLFVWPAFALAGNLINPMSPEEAGDEP